MKALLDMPVSAALLDVLAAMLGAIMTQDQECSLLREKITGLRHRWDSLNEVINALGEQKDLETRTEERIRLKHLIEEKKADLREIEQELLELEQRLELLDRANGWLSSEQRQFLADLFQTRNVNELCDWCHQAMPPNQPHELPVDVNALDLLEWLIERGQLADQQVPLLRVLRKLLPPPSLNDTSRNQLEQCIQKIANHFHVFTTSIQSIPKNKAGALALIVEIWPNAALGNRCDVQGWLFFSLDNFFSICTKENETAVKLDDRENQVDLVEELVEKIRKHRVHEKQVMIEFAFPRQLLSHPVEQWCSKGEEPLGVRWPVVVRPRERLREEPSPVYWDYWAMLNATNKMPGLWWFEKQDWIDVRDKLEEGCCIVCGFVPDLLAERRQHDLHYLLFDTEIPIALWPRRPEDCLADFCEAALQAALIPGSLRKLPTIIHRMRRKLLKEKQQNTAYYHLTLLWDDPNRRLPRPVKDDDFLQSPV